MVRGGEGWMGERGSSMKCEDLAGCLMRGDDVDDSCRSFKESDGWWWRFEW